MLWQYKHETTHCALLKTKYIYQNWQKYREKRKRTQVIVSPCARLAEKTATKSEPKLLDWTMTFPMGRGHLDGVDMQFGFWFWDFVRVLTVLLYMFFWMFLTEVRYFCWLIELGTKFWLRIAMLDGESGFQVIAKWKRKDGPCPHPHNIAFKGHDSVSLEPLRNQWLENAIVWGGRKHDSFAGHVWQPDPPFAACWWRHKNKSIAREFAVPSYGQQAHLEYWNICAALVRAVDLTRKIGETSKIRNSINHLTSSPVNQKQLLCVYQRRTEKFVEQTMHKYAHHYRTSEYFSGNHFAVSEFGPTRWSRPITIAPYVILPSSESRGTFGQMNRV